MSKNECKTIIPKKNHADSKTILSFITDNAISSPSAIAIYSEERAINYQELHHKSNQLAHYIHNHKPNFVGNIVIYMERCVESILCLLAIIKSNNTYVPMDYDTAEEQFAQIVKDCNPHMLLTTKPLKKSIADIAQKYGMFVVNIGDNQKSLHNMPVCPPRINLTNKIAYILYTSGTTGKPKGVKITHCALINFLFSMKEKINFSSNDIFLSLTPITFDISAAEIYIPLLTGTSLAFVDNYVRYEPIKLQYCLSKFNVSVMQATPVTWQMLIENGWKNETNIKVISGGEALPVHLAQKLRAISKDVWNFYGPTETTVWSTFYKIDTIDETRAVVAIGKPLANTHIYVLDEVYQQQPVGKPGELYIGGAGVAAGYLNRPELNKTCFIPNPFSQAINDRLYKTGDLVEQDEEGNLHYLGRIDTQIKIRGHRIEASAIENAMMNYQGIKNCVVIDKNPQQQHELVAYLILNEHDLALKHLQEYLKAQFPSYMVPTRFVIVDSYPLTANGKIDRNNISHIKNVHYLGFETSDAPLDNQYEEIVMALIQSALQREDLDPETNFFDLGLHSMLLVNIAQTLNHMLAQPISAVDLFEHPTVRSFAEFLLKTYPLEGDKQSNLKVTSKTSPTYNQPHSDDHRIAVIGMACKVPGAEDYNAFWDLIIQKKETIDFFSAEELEKSGLLSDLYLRKDYVPARGILSDIDKFDAAFFGYTPAEARIMDPQHRIFLEQSWSALEDAGYCTSHFAGKIGVYAGMNDSTYLSNHLLQHSRLKADYDNQQLLLATSTHYLSTKVAYALDLKGPSVTVNTACSTGLVSIAMACNSLVAHDCDMALAGAVTIVTPQQTGYLYQELGILSPDGHCRVFDDSAQGTVLSNGCGVVVLKRLSDALKDNDHILGVIKGWALNNDGAGKVGFTAPSIEGQISCARDALLRANIEPTEVEYIEAHGTGTLMGDPIEIASLSKAYDYDIHQTSQYCALGSVKANIGHTDSASGTIGFIKSILALYHKALPPQINYTQGNPHIDFEHSPFYVNRDACSWETTHKKRTAAIHSLGFGGTNAHMIVQEAPPIKTTPSKGANLLVVSAKTEHSLQANLQAISRYILNDMPEQSTDMHLADVAYTLQIGRQAFKWRTAIAYHSLEHLRTLLNAPAHLKKHTANNADKKSSRIIFGFTGQGSQYAGMASDIYDEHPYFKHIIDNCCIDLQPDLGIDLRHLLFPKAEDTSSAHEQLRKTHYTQPALFVIEYALAKLLMSFGVMPHAMIGHSIGEYVAATLSGVLSLKDALKLVALRGKLMASTQSGTMLVVPLSLEDIKPYLNNDIELAVHNAPNLNVVAGLQDKIAQFEQDIEHLLAPAGLNCKTLFTSHAFHSQWMDPILEAFSTLTVQLRTITPSIPYLSNVTGNWISQQDLENKHYWTQHVRQPVLFSKGVETLQLSDKDVVIEIGPGRVLTQFIQQHTLASKPLLLQTLGSATESTQNSYTFFLTTLGKLWLHHQPLDWDHLYTNEIRQRCALPTYAFDRHSYWVDASVDLEPRNIRKNVENILYKPIWEQDKKLSPHVLYNENTLKKCVIIFCDDEQKRTLFLKENDLHGIDIYIVSSGPTFQRFDQQFIINPLNKEDYILCFNHMNKNYEAYYVIHTWLSDNDPTANTLQCLAKGPYCLLYLTQTFGEYHANKLLKVLVVTTQIQSVLGNEDILPAKATVLGPCKVIPQEQDNVAFKSIDLEYSSAWTSGLIKHLYSELYTISSNAFKQDIAYRGAYRWIKKLAPCDKEIANSPNKRLKKQGVYIITGGLGGIGLSIAAHLAKHYSANIVLLTRSDFPHESEWQTYVANENNKNQKQYKKIKTLLSIQKNAHTLTVECAAVENSVRLHSVIQSIKKRFHTINGVIHAAGVAGGGVAQFKTIETYADVLRPKLEGTHNLIACLKDEPLDLMVLISSITAITGFPGQIDYCSANRALDAYANKNDNFNHPVFCVAMNWLAWREVGMAADSQTLLIHLDQSNSISTEEGCHIFETIINAECNQMIVSKDDLNHYEIPKPSLPDYSHTHGENSNIEATLLHLWQQVLGVEHITIDDDFYELGGHSLLAISLLSKIRHQLEVNIPSTTLFQVKTIRALATMIASYKQEQENYSPLVVLRPGNAEKPSLFLVHPAGGTVFCYMQLANILETDRTIYAFQDPSIEAEKSLFSNITEMAAFYLEHIQKIQAQGPYYLSGASFGSLVVMEIVHLLEQQNETVQFAGIIDGWGTHGQTRFDGNYVREIIHYHHPDYQKNLHVDKQSLWESLLQQRLNMMLNYHYKQVHSPMVLFKAIELLPEYKMIDAFDNHWSTYVASLSVQNIVGDHNTMMQEPNVTMLAREISYYLNDLAPGFLGVNQ